MQIYSDADAKGLQLFEQMYFNPKTGEAVLFFPKPEVDPDASPAALRGIRDRDVYVGTGLFFEAAFQALPLAGENPDTSRVPQLIAPWNFAKADTVNTVTGIIQPVLQKLGAEVVGVALAKQNPQFPYVQADGDPLRSRELIVNTANGITKRFSVGQLAAMLAHSTYEKEPGQYVFSTRTIFEDVERQLLDAAGAGETSSVDRDVDMVPEE